MNEEMHQYIRILFIILCLFVSLIFLKATPAEACYEEGHYAEATSAYETLGQYELSLSKLPIARYAWADQLFKEGKYAEAAEQFTTLGEMTNSSERAKESTYQLANQQMEAKKIINQKIIAQI